jgi:hypothetical protein
MSIVTISIRRKITDERNKAGSSLDPWGTYQRKGESFTIGAPKGKGKSYVEEDIPEKICHGRSETSFVKLKKNN